MTQLMKNHTSLLLAALVAAVGGTHAAAAATVVFTDTFDSRTAPWYKAYNSNLHFPASGPTQWLFQEPPAKSNS